MKKTGQTALWDKIFSLLSESRLATCEAAFFVSSLCSAGANRPLHSERGTHSRARNACCGARTSVLYCAALSCVIHVAARGKVSCPQAIPRLHIKARCHGRAVPRMALSDACTARKGCLRKATHKARNRFDRPCRFCRSSHSHAMGAHYAVQRAMSSKIFMAMRRFPRLNAHKYAPNKLPPTTIYQNILYAGGRAC